jgi:hypothetical protein
LATAVIPDDRAHAILFPQVNVEPIQEVVERRRQQHRNHREKEDATEECVNSRKDLRGGLEMGAIGPMPVRIIAAFSTASSQGSPSSVW